MNNSQNARSLSEREEKILQEERQILTEERKILKEEKNMLRRLQQNIWLSTALIIATVAIGLGGYIYWQEIQSRVYIDKAEVSAAQIDLAPETSGVLKEIYVKEGNAVEANDKIALVGNELIKAKIKGTVISVKNDVGKIFNRGEPVATMIDAGDLRIEGRIGEDKGLSDIRVGQRSVFTVDAYGSKEYVGTVDEISPSSRQNAISFSISDKRATHEFTVKIRFNTDEYPELKNGMSAKIWIYK